MIGLGRFKVFEFESESEIEAFAFDGEKEKAANEWNMLSDIY